MITLGSLSLPDSLWWRDLSEAGAVEYATRRRQDGGLLVSYRALSGGRTLTLEARSDAPITESDRQALVTMAAAPGAAYSLAIPERGFSAEVLILALDLTPLIDYSDPDDADPVVGTLTLLTLP